MHEPHQQMTSGCHLLSPSHPMVLPEHIVQASIVDLVF